MRQLADESLRELEPVIADWAAQTEAGRLGWFLAHETSEDVGNNLGQTRFDLITIAETRHSEAEGTGFAQIEEKYRAPLSRAVLLLSWADALAGDYMDPRIEAAREIPTR